MTDPRTDAVTGAIIDETVEVTLEQITTYCAVDQAQIRALVEEGVLEPRGGRTEWRFAGQVMHRAARAVRLQRELELNAHAVAVVLDLLDEIDALRSRIGHANHRSTG